MSPDHQALRAMRRCRNQHSKVMVMECHGCHHQVAMPPPAAIVVIPIANSKSVSSGWIVRKGKFLKASYFMVTFTIPAELRSLIWAHQRVAYDLLMKTAWQTIDSFSRRDPYLKGRSGAHAVLHTHTRDLNYLPVMMLRVHLQRSAIAAMLIAQYEASLPGLDRSNQLRRS